MRDKTVKDAMTPLESVFMLHEDDKIGHANMEKVKCGLSFINVPLIT